MRDSYLQIGVEGGVFALILYLLFFWRGFANLRRLRKQCDLDPETVLLVEALQSSLVGFAVGAMFAPEAYQFFPYFMVAQTSVLLFIVMERESDPAVAQVNSGLARLQNSRDARGEALRAMRFGRPQTSVGR